MATRPVAVRNGMLILSLVAGAGRAAGQTVDTFTDLSQVVKKGSVVYVQDEKGERTKGKITELSDRSLQIMTGGISGGTLTFTVDRVTRVSKVDSRLNGFLIGAIAGAVPGLLLGHALNSWCENELGSNCWVTYPYSGGLTALAGGWIGFAIDGAIDGQTLVFRRPGITMSVKF